MRLGSGILSKAPLITQWSPSRMIMVLHSTSKVGSAAPSGTKSVLMFVASLLATAGSVMASFDLQLCMSGAEDHIAASDRS